MKFSTHKELKTHHRYQLEVIFLFVVGLFLFLPYWLLIEEFQHNIDVWQWYFFWPWMAMYVLYSLYTRSRVSRKEYTDPLMRPIIHWVLLGVTLVMIHQQPNDLQLVRSIDVMFGVFSLFLADSFWSFKKDT